MDVPTITALVQAGAALIMLYLTYSISQANKHQSKNTALQSKYMKMQIELSLYKQRYSIYTSIMTYINNVKSIPIPKQGETCYFFLQKYNEHRSQYWQETKEKTFLFDNDMVKKIEDIENALDQYLQKIVNQEIPHEQQKYGQWSVEVCEEALKLTSLYETVFNLFTEYMSYQRFENGWSDPSQQKT